MAKNSKFSTKLTIISLIISIFLAFFSYNSYAKNPTNLTIFSESNMTYALTKIARYYSKKKNVAISINFNSSFDLINNIDLGEPADIFVSSHIDWVKNLSQKGLVDRYSSLNFAQDQLVLVTSKNNKKLTIEDLKEAPQLNQILKIISQKKVPLIVGSQYSSLGRYTAKILEESNIDNFQIFQKLNEDKKSITDFINQNNDYCAIVMASEIKNNKNITILSEVPFVEIDYRALVIAGDNMENARKFIAFLQEPEAKKILKEDGFMN